MYKFQNNEGRVFSTGKDDWQASVERLLAAAELAARLREVETILVKPNLVEALEPPITTPVELVESLVIYLKSAAPEAEILIGEGTGSIEYDTYHCFETLGYTKMASRLGVGLVDLNNEELRLSTKRECSRWPEMYLPKLLDRVFLLSVPVLKAHSLSRVTLTMKNMMGCAPPAHYQEGGCWGKSAFHSRIHEAVFDLNRYRTPDFTLLDATIGMSQAHLWGPHCDPPVGRLAASYDPVAIDSFGCELLGRKWQSVGHISMAHGELGLAEPLEVIEI